MTFAAGGVNVARPGAILLVIAMSLSPAADAQQRQRHGPQAEAAPLLEQVIRESWPEPRPEWRSRLAQDEIMRLCSRYRSKPPRRVAEAIQRIARATIVYPADSVLIGDWKAGEAIAQSGYGGRFTDVDTSRPNGGNCYACHRIDRAEQSFGTLGPDLNGYGRTKGFEPAAVRKVYEQVYNAHSHTPCSEMPRFGASGTLTVEQIKNIVGLLMSRESPVNR